MWEWFTANGLLILSASIIIVMILVLLLNKIHDIVEKLQARKKQQTLHRAIYITIWGLIGIGAGLITTSLVAVVISREGINSLITTTIIQEWMLKHGIFILIIIAITYLLSRMAKELMPKIIVQMVQSAGKGRRAREEQAKRARTLSDVLHSVVNINLVLIAFLLILSELEINIAPFLAGAGIAGIAVGFGAQSLIKDVVRGFLILLQNQYSKGDVVRVVGIAGLVEEVNISRTVLRDLDGIVHSIPNGEITTASNFTKEWSRVNLDVAVAYGEDLDHVTEVINRVGNELSKDEYFGSKIITAPQTLRVNNFGDSGIEIKILGETKPLTQWEVTGELRKRLKKAFDEEGIEIPWPHVKLYFGQGRTDEYLMCKACSHVNFQGSKFCSICGASLQK